MKKILFLLIFCSLISCKQEKKYDADEVQKMVDQKVEEKIVEKNQTETKNDTNDTKQKKSNISLSDIKSRKGSYSDYQKDLETRMDPLDKTFDPESYTEESFNHNLDLGDKWDIELNKIYKIVINKLTSEQKKELQSEERKWLKNMEDSSLPSSARIDNAMNRYLSIKERTYYLVKLNSKIDQQ